MKIENFDDALKRKLENVNTSYEESDIQRVHDYVTRNHTLGRVRNPKRSWILAGSSMIIAGLIMWNVILINQNRELHQTVNGLHSELSSINKKQTVKSPNSITSKENVTASNNYISQAVVPKQIVPLSSEKNVSSMAPVKNENVKNIPENNKKEESIALNADNNTPVVAPTSQEGIAQEAQTVKTDEKKSNEVITESIKKDTVVPEKKLVAEISQPVQDETANNDKAKDEGRRSLSILKNIHYNAGVNLIGGRNQVGCGISGEALLKDRWGLSVGMNVLGINNEKYNDENDFHKWKHTQFVSAYNLHNNDSVNHFFHINIDDILFQLPVAINYHMELRHNFSFIVGLGTDLDIHVKQHIGYLHRMDTITNNDKIGHQFYPIFFNDLAFSAGLQKRWGLFSFQLCPYASYQVRQVIYKKEKLYYGLRFGIKYNFPS